MLCALIERAVEDKVLRGKVEWGGFCAGGGVLLRGCAGTLLGCAGEAGERSEMGECLQIFSTFM